MLALSEEKYHSVLTAIRDILFLLASHAIHSLIKMILWFIRLNVSQEEISELRI